MRAMKQHPQLRFDMIMAAFCGVIILLYRDDILGSVLTPLTTMTARATLALLHWTGIEAVRTATQIYHPDGFAYEIYYRCTGFLPAAFLTVAVLAYPRSLIHKLCGLAVGVSVLLALNLTRLVHLFYIGVYNPTAFEVAHTVIWQAVIILITVALWLVWIKWSATDKIIGSV